MGKDWDIDQLLDRLSENYSWQLCVFASGILVPTLLKIVSRPQCGNDNCVQLGNIHIPLEDAGAWRDPDDAT